MVGEDEGRVLPGDGGGVAGDGVLGDAPVDRGTAVIAGRELEAGEETRYLSDETREVSGEETRVSGTTVLPGTGSSSEAPVAVQVLGPVYRGAVVVAEGADRAAVRLSLVNAVSSLTGLGADHITVIKMK